MTGPGPSPQWAGVLCRTKVETPRAESVEATLHTMSQLRIAGGRVIDPAHSVDEVRDLWIRDGVVVPPPGPDERPDRTIDASGDVVMPGGVDIHCHIAGPKVNAGRIFRPEDKSLAPAPFPGARSGTWGSVPSTFTTGYRYAGLGYTTAFDAAIAPLGARLAHFELADTPVVDKGFFVLVGNNHYVMDRVRDGGRDRLKSFLAWLLAATRGYALKIVNPGGIEQWKQGRGNVSSLDDVVGHFDVTPRRILAELARAADELGLPHPVHVHCNNLGLPGNAETTLETMRALDGHRAHLTHIQFHSYGGTPDQSTSLSSRVEGLAEWFNAHPGLTVDVGQVVFGDTTSMTADGAVGQFLARLTGRKWISHDLEHETGCGVVPIEYQDKNLVHAVQWAVGLEWFLRVNDPWRIALSTDHPNGGSFLAYPRIIAWLMDRGHRNDLLKGLPEKLVERTGLADLDREYTLSEIAIITRAAPARMLGLASKGHLGPGADGDVTIYRPDADKERMFSLPRWVVKRGEVILDDGELRSAPAGLVHATERGFDPGDLDDIAAWWNETSSIRFANFPVRDEDLRS